MIDIDIRDHECIKIFGEAAVDLFVELEDVGDTETNGTTMATYTIRVVTLMAITKY